LLLNSYHRDSNLWSATFVLIKSHRLIHKLLHLSRSRRFWGSFSVKAWEDFDFLISRLFLSNYCKILYVWRSFICWNLLLRRFLTFNMPFQSNSLPLLSFRILPKIINSFYSPSIDFSPVYIRFPFSKRLRISVRDDYLARNNFLLSTSILASTGRNYQSLSWVPRSEVIFSHDLSDVINRLHSFLCVRFIFRLV